MKIQITKLSETATLPSKGSDGAAGYDLRYDGNEAVTMYPTTRKLFHTGLAVAIPEGYFGAIYARSGLAIKHGIRPANCVGVIDSDYRGEIMVGLVNDTKTTYEIEPGTRIAQLIIQKCEDIEFEEVNKLDDTDRGEGGFGSTGAK